MPGSSGNISEQMRHLACWLRRRRLAARMSQACRVLLPRQPIRQGRLLSRLGEALSPGRTKGRVTRRGLESRRMTLEAYGDWGDAWWSPGGEQTVEA